MRTGRRGRRPLQDKRLRYRILYLRLNDFATKITAVTFGNEDFTTTSFAISTTTKILSNTFTKIQCVGIMMNCMQNKNDLIKKTVGKPTVFCFLCGFLSALARTGVPISLKAKSINVTINDVYNTLDLHDRKRTKNF